MNWKRSTLYLLVILALMLAACNKGGTPAAATEQAKPVTITVWDYYGEATPVKPLIEPFQKENPNITIKYEALDWDTTLEKLNVVLTGGTPPDVVTVD